LRWPEGIQSVASQFVAGAATAFLLLGAAPAPAETTITGVEGELLANVKAYLDVDDLDCEAAEPLVRQALESAADEATEALNAYGYYSPSIETHLDFNEDCWQAVVSIDPGEPVRLRDVDIELSGPAADNAAFQALPANSMLVAGARLDQGAYENLKRGLVDLARNRGYAEARFEASRIDIYPDDHVADLSLHFESGPRYAIGNVTLNEDALDPDFVSAFYDLMPGAPFDNRLLTAAFLGLNNSGYFSSVDVRAMPADPETRTIPVEVDLTAAPRRRVSYGVGFSTDTGPRVRFGRTVRRINRQGHQLSIEGQLSPVVSELTSIYRMPFGDPRFDWINFNLGAKREETDTSLARSIEAGVRRVYDRPGGWSRTPFLNFVVEDFEVGSQTGRPRLLIPGIDWTRIEGDDALRPDNGSKLDFEARAANEALVSDTSFVQTTARVKWIRSVWEHSRLLFRGAAGYTSANEFERLPPSIRFFAGGDQSIRGFGFESLGPVDENGAVIGGTRLIELSAEYEREIKPRWSIAIFADSGNAFNGRHIDMRTGAGIGARWRSPLGPVRVDIAWPVNDIEHGARLHVSLGPDL
jgi:translocation and assembly module TamA